MTYRSNFPIWALAVDLCLFSVRDDVFSTLLVERGEEPFEGRLALPGGFVQPDEGPTAAALRELREETGVALSPTDIEQLRTYADPGRDPRPERVASIAHVAFLPDLPAGRGGTDARAARWVPVEEALATELAFDHGQILRDGVERARGKLEYTTIAARFCGPTFTIGRLHAVYEAVAGRPIDARNFRRKVLAADGFLVDTGETSGGVGRPGRLYRWGGAERIHPPLALL